MLELVDKDAETTITNILHMFKNMMKKLQKKQKKMKSTISEMKNILKWDQKLQTIRLVI